MNQLGSSTLPSQPKKSPAANPFARALMETENSLSHNPQAQSATNPFADAMARSGGAFGDLANGMTDFSNENGFSDYSDPNSMNGMPNGWDEEQAQRLQEEQEKQRKLDMMRRKLHDQVNPVDKQSVFDAREAEVKKQIEDLRRDLRQLSVEIKSFHKDVELTLLTETAEPGMTGTYFVNFFNQLRQFIMLLRQKISSARTWMNAASAKKKKKPKRGGILIEGQQHEQTASVYDMMNHERSSTYGGS